MIAAAVREQWYGSVQFTVSGGFPSLFLEECASRGVVLSEVIQEGGSVRSSVRESDYPHVRIAAEKAGMALTVERHVGLPHLLFRYRARAGIPVGLMLAALLVWYLSGTLWQITVRGNEALSEVEILDVMEELGVCRGAHIKSVNVKDVVRRAQDLLPRLSWIAVNIKGCKAEVEVREIFTGDEPPGEGAFANIVASQDGVIVRADVLSGDGKLKVGDAVVKGDVLVSGVVEMKNGFYRLTQARAIIEALTVTELSVSADRRFPAEHPVKEQALYGIRFFWWQIPFGIALHNGEQETDERDIQSRNTVLPIGSTYKKIVIYESKETVLDENMARLVCFEEFCRQAYQRYRDADVTEIVVNLLFQKNRCETAARFRCIENIALRVPFDTLNEADGTGGQKNTFQ